MAASVALAGQLRGEAEGGARLSIPRSPLGRTGRRDNIRLALRKAAGFAAQAIAETLYATRCVICDTPGSDLCPRCRQRLPYIDRYLACNRCGAPYGRQQCTECNTVALAEVGRRQLPFDGCASAIVHVGRARSLVTAYKDAGQQQLSQVIAALLSCIVPPAWLDAGCVLSFVPADRRARQRRGFDHMLLVATCLADLLGLPMQPLLQKEAAADQRGLTRGQRFANMEGAIRLRAPEPGVPMPARVLLVDDVYTTGATLFAACDALHDAGVEEVRCATFARAP